MIDFKHPALRDEFAGRRSVDGQTIHPKIRAPVFALSGYADYHWGKSLTVTEILRDAKTQDRYYRGSASYQRKPWKSVHQFGCGVDFRAANFTEAETAEMLAFLNDNFDYGDDKHKTAVCHDIGLGKHLHLQIHPDTPR